jgi:hypothetical protein
MPEGVNYLTLLSISGIDVPPYATRNLTQTLEPINQAKQTRRTVNGTLKDISAAQFQKYKSTITCTDQQSPGLDGIWPGLQVTVDCVGELSYKTSVGSPERPVVTDSSRTDGDWTFYRPQLIMRVISYSIQTDEYGGAVGWQLDLEEV